MTETTAPMNLFVEVGFICRRMNDKDGHPGIPLFELTRVAGEEAEFEAAKRQIGDALAAWNRRATQPALSASPAPAVAEGWRLVPVEPTSDMLKPLDRFMRPEAARELLREVFSAAPSSSPAQAVQGEALTDRLPAGHVVLEQADMLDGRVSQTVRRPDGAEYERIVSAEEAYGDDNATPPAGEWREAPVLWCVHHIGPDDLHPVESYEAAVKMADAINDQSEKFNFGHKPESMDYVYSRAYPAIWTGTPESHTEWLEKRRAAALRSGEVR